MKHCQVAVAHLPAMHEMMSRTVCSMQPEAPGTHAARQIMVPWVTTHYCENQTGTWLLPALLHGGQP